MAEKFKAPKRIDPASDAARGQLMKECLRKAEDIRRGLEGRKHSNSAGLIAENRKRLRSVRAADERK